MPRKLLVNHTNNFAHLFPSPQAPVSPIFSSHSCKLKRQTPTFGSILGIDNLIHVSSGRAAICLALENAGVEKGDEVMVPAFHCESMISPVKWRKATTVFYQVNADTSLNLDDIESKISNSTKAIIATHYFGFIQNLKGLRSLCDKHGVLLIEDCAHAFFGHDQGIGVGEVGDYAIASSMKFFPVYDGGILASKKHRLDNIQTMPPPKLFTVKALINVLDRSARFSRMGLLGRLVKFGLDFQSRLRNHLKRASSKRLTTGPGSSDGGYELDENWIHKNATKLSAFIIEHNDFELNTEKRRDNYQKINQVISKTPGVRPLFTELPPGIVPLIYPAYIEEPEKYFSSLKYQGVPIWRFGEFLDPMIDENICKNSINLSRHVFQFPCHQELTKEELEWMTSTIEKTFRDQQA